MVFLYTTVQVHKVILLLITTRGIALHLQVVDQLSPGCVPLQGSGSTTCSKLWLKCKVNAAEMW